MEFWFEYASTYSHIAAQRVEALAAAAGVSIEWRAFLLGPIFQAQGWSDSPFNLYPAKGAYMWRDMERECARLGVPFARPSVFPRNGLNAARVTASAQGAPWVPAFVRAVYLANFRDDADISQDAVLEPLLTAAGAPDAAAVLANSRSAEAKDRLRATTAEAVARGIFGAPTFVVGGELFWGADRLEQALDWARAAA